MILQEKYMHVNRLEELVPLSLQIMRFKMMSQRRKAVRHGESTQVSVEDIQLPDARPDPADLFERRERMERLQGALQQLEERCQRMFRWKVEGRTFEEIRQAMGAHSINTIYTWDFRCRKRLLELLGGSWEPRS